MVTIMTSPIFLNDLPKEQLKNLSKEEIEQLQRAEALYWANKPRKMYYCAVNGAKTKLGGLVRASYKDFKIKNMSVARIGDEAIYPDGTTAKIITGAGSALVIDGKSAALIGSRLENGDEIIDSPNTSLAISIFPDVPKPKGFLDHK